MYMIESMITKYVSALFLSLTLFSCAQDENAASFNTNAPESLEISAEQLFDKQRKVTYKIQKKIAREYLEKNNKYNREIVFLLDMKRPSGDYRFFVHDLMKDSIIHSGLVAHGSGSELTEGDSLVFSNVPNSYQSSLGKYRIGGKYTGNFGKSYKLHGLDPTNSNAFKRYVVLHPYSAVPDLEQGYPIMLSLGCPMVSDNFMKTLHGIIDPSPKSILMIMYY